MCTSKIHFTVFPIFLSLLMTYGCQPSETERSRALKSDEKTTSTKEAAAAVGDVESIPEGESSVSGTDASAIPESIPEGSTGLELTASLTIGTSGTLRAQPTVLRLTSSGGDTPAESSVTGSNANVELIDSTMNIANIRFFANRKPTSEEEKGIKDLKEKLKLNAKTILAGRRLPSPKKPSNPADKPSIGFSPVQMQARAELTRAMSLIKRYNDKKPETKQFAKDALQAIQKAEEILGKAKTLVNEASFPDAPQIAQLVTKIKEYLKSFSKDFFLKFKGPGCELAKGSGKSLQNGLVEALSIGSKNLKFLESPWLFNVSNPGPIDPDLFKGKLKDGDYNRIDFHIVPYLENEAHKMFCKSLLVVGTFQRDDSEVPFTLEASTPLHIQLASDADKSLRIENEGSNIIISFDTNKWFKDVDMATAQVTSAEEGGSPEFIVLSETQNQNLFRQAVKNIMRSAVFALDDDGDQQVSESEEVGESSATPESDEIIE